MKPRSALGSIVTETKRLILREFRRTDAGALMNIFGDEEVMRYGDALKDETWVKPWIQEQQARYQMWGYGNWAVVLKTSDKTIGYCGLTYAPDLDGCAEIALGYRLAREYWGFGYATEAVRASLDYGLNVLELNSIIATIDPNNLASIRVAERVGMVYEKDIMLDWYTHPDYLYRIGRKTLNL